jgi:hypothetical protein
VPFGIPSGQLLGYVVSKRGIEANPKKINAMRRLHKPECLLDVQMLAGCVAALSRFIPKLGPNLLTSLEVSEPMLMYITNGVVSTVTAIE